MVENLLLKIKESFPLSYDSIKEIIDSKNYHLLLDLDIKEDSKIKILRSIFSKNYVNIFKTRKAREQQVQLINKIKNYIVTDYAKELLFNFFPTANKDEILNRQKTSQLAKDSFDSIKDNLDSVKSLIKNISSISYSSDKRHNGIVIVFADNSLYSEMKSDLSKKFYVTFIESEHDLLSIDHYEEIRFIPGKNDSFTHLVEQLSQASILLGSPSIEEIAPEVVTDILDDNSLAIDSLYLLNEYLPLKNIPLRPENFSASQVSFIDVEKKIISLSLELESVIQSEISKAAFAGDTLISIISDKKSLIDLLDVSSQEIIRHKKQEVMSLASDILGSSTSALFNIDYVGKVSVDDSQLDIIKQQFITSQQQDLTKQKQGIASLASDLVSSLPSIVEEVYNFDLLIAIGNFISFYDLEKPTITGKGISFVYGKNMNISNVVPVEYYIGTGSEQSVKNTENISVLTGANSGGKTTLLELLAQIQLLTQMGLFVPAKEASVGIIEEFYYFSKNKGSLSAGAFETLLKQFAQINDTNSPRLILADEIESVTEPSVAAKIIKGIINHLSSSSKTILVLVTHMGNELYNESLPCRFDGIEAKGLDDDLNLVVDRNPIIGRLARSTPQLIVERLAKKENSVFYDELYKAILAD